MGLYYTGGKALCPVWVIVSAGTGTTTVAAAKWGRNSIGVEIDPHYCELAERRIRQATESLFSSAHFEVTSE
jgi:DNA modification methylase